MASPLAVCEAATRARSGTLPSRYREPQGLLTRQLHCGNKGHLLSSKPSAIQRREGSTGAINTTPCRAQVQVMTQCYRASDTRSPQRRKTNSGEIFGVRMIDGAISVGFAAALAVGLGWCLWRVCKMEVNLRASKMSSNLISAQLSGAANVVPKEEMKAKELAKAA
jgi:hypothetical protein